MKLKPKHLRAQRKLVKTKPGTVVHIVWLDSGVEGTKAEQLAVRDLYGRMESVDEHGRVTLAMDVCQTDDHGRWGHVWLPSVLECWRLRR